MQTSWSVALQTRHWTKYTNLDLDHLDIKDKNATIISKLEHCMTISFASWDSNLMHDKRHETRVWMDQSSDLRGANAVARNWFAAHLFLPGWPLPSLTQRLSATTFSNCRHLAAPRYARNASCITTYRNKAHPSRRHPVHPFKHLPEKRASPGRWRSEIEQHTDEMSAAHRSATVCQAGRCLPLSYHDHGCGR